MKHLITIIFASAVLAACTAQQGPAGFTLEKRLENPLFAERYAKMLIERMTELEIRKDPILEDQAMKIVVQETRNHWMEVDREARRVQIEGLRGGFIGVKEYTMGEALLLNSTLFIGSEFEADPGPALNLYLTEAADPRDVDFPDPSSIKIGPLQSPYGAQRYQINPDLDLSGIRTVVLFDDALRQIHGFAQLSR